MREWLVMFVHWLQIARRFEKVFQFRSSKRLQRSYSNSRSALLTLVTLLRTLTSPTGQLSYILVTWLIPYASIEYMLHIECDVPRMILQQYGRRNLLSIRCFSNMP
jgi:hypothetical protein